VRWWVTSRQFVKDWIGSSNTSQHNTWWF